MSNLILLILVHGIYQVKYDTSATNTSNGVSQPRHFLGQLFINRREVTKSSLVTFAKSVGTFPNRGSSIKLSSCFLEPLWYMESVGFCPFTFCSTMRFINSILHINSLCIVGSTRFIICMSFKLPYYSWIMSSNKTPIS